MTDQKLLNNISSLRIIKIDKDNFVNGPGIRIVIWVSGCNHNCPNCHNPETHDMTAGDLLNQRHLDVIRSEMFKEYIDGVTISGGDPLLLDNRQQSLMLAEWIKSNFPEKTIIMYTGYLYEKLSSSIQVSIKQNLDWLIDGPYLKDRPKAKWRGSDNQRIIQITNRIPMSDSL